MALTEEERKQRRYQKLLQNSKTKQIGTYRKEVARDLQKAIRMEAALFVGHVKAVVDGELTTVESPHGQCVCVTCGKLMEWNTPACNAGHFLGGRSDSIVFEEVGIHPQCAHCNQYRSGAPEEYRTYMDGMYGVEVIQELENRKRGFVRDVGGREHKLVPSTRDQLVTRRIGYLDRIKAAESKLKQGLSSMVANVPDIPSSYDYEGVTESTRVELMQAAEQIRKTGRQVAYGVGKLLNSKKHLLPHGEFQKWVEDECGLDYRRAANWMRVAVVFKSADSTLLESISIQALVDLAAKSCPLEAVEEALFLAGSEYVTYTKARAIIGKHKEARKAPQQELPLTDQAEPTAVDTAEPEPELTDEELQERSDNAVQGAIDQMEIGLSEQEEPEDPPEDFILTQIQVFFDDADFEMKCRVVKWMMGTDIYDFVAGNPAAVESGGVVDAASVSKVKTPEKPKSKETKKTPKPTQYTDAFEAFWKVWPSRKRSKPTAFKAWQKALDKVELDYLMDAVGEFAASPEGQSASCPGPAPWLNQERWDDDRQAWQVGANSDGPTVNGTMEAVAGYLGSD